MQWQPPSPGQTTTAENGTFPKNTYAGGKNRLSAKCGIVSGKNTGNVKNSKSDNQFLLSTEFLVKLHLTLQIT